VDGSAAPATMHAGAVYVHQGEYFTVLELDLEAHVALVAPTTDEIFTMALSRKQLDVVAVVGEVQLGQGRLRRGDVAVTTEVYAFQRRRTGTGEVLSTHPLDLPAQVLQTSAVWWSWPDDVVAGAGVVDVAGAAHAAEHAAIGLLPLVATCDRWDVGGLSTVLHPATGEATVFIYDGYPGGVGYAFRGFDMVTTWLAATRDVVAGCDCEDGCPRCVQSPKCGNANNPLDKAGAVRLLDSLLT
jgi:DEAD/DEAH box helicase domain-containing protein